MEIMAKQEKRQLLIDRQIDRKNDKAGKVCREFWGRERDAQKGEGVSKKVLTMAGSGGSRL